MQHGHTTMGTWNSRHLHLGEKIPENWPIQKFLSHNFNQFSQ